MKDQNFVIKVSDLLKEAGKIDIIELTNKKTNQIENIDDDGINGELKIQSFNQESVYATLKKVSCTLNETCDTCQASYQRDIIIDSYGARFVIGLENQKLEQETTDDDVFLIDAKYETINIEDMIAQAIKLEEPIVKHCPSCEKIISEMPDEDDGEYFESNSNITFR